MGTVTGISWTDKTFNIVWGCTHYDECCKFCYAERIDSNPRFSKTSHWGVKNERRIMSEKYWKQPIAWNKNAEKLNTTYKVFCSSMADWAEDHPQVAMERKKLFPLIQTTPNLIWQLLSKRYDKIEQFLPENWGDGYDNAWLGISVGSQSNVDKYLPVFINIPAKVRFLSCEPLLGKLDLLPYLQTRRIHQVIIGGESGYGEVPNDPSVKYRYRKCELEWIEDIVNQCKKAKVPVFVKQMGTHLAKQMNLNDKTGSDINEFPEHLRFQDFPKLKTNGERQQQSGARIIGQFTPKV